MQADPSALSWPCSLVDFYVLMKPSDAAVPVYTFERLYGFNTVHAWHTHRQQADCSLTGLHSQNAPYYIHFLQEPTQKQRSVSTVLRCGYAKASIHAKKLYVPMRGEGRCMRSWRNLWPPPPSLLSASTPDVNISKSLQPYKDPESKPHLPKLSCSNL